MKGRTFSKSSAFFPSRKTNSESNLYIYNVLLQSLQKRFRLGGEETHGHSLRPHLLQRVHPTSVLSETKLQLRELLLQTGESLSDFPEPNSDRQNLLPTNRFSSQVASEIGSQTGRQGEKSLKGFPREEHLESQEDRLRARGLRKQFGFRSLELPQQPETAETVQGIQLRQFDQRGFLLLHVFQEPQFLQDRVQVQRVRQGRPRVRAEDQLSHRSGSANQRQRRILPSIGDTDGGEVRDQGKEVPEFLYGFSDSEMRQAVLQ